MEQHLVEKSLGKLQLNSKVLLAWTSDDAAAFPMQRLVDEVRAKITPEGSVDVLLVVDKASNVESASSYDASSFDLVVSVGSSSSKALATFMKLLRPKGSLLALETSSSTAAGVKSEMKLNGFLNVADEAVESDAVLLAGDKANFELGAASKLNIGAQKKKALWKFDEDDLKDPANDDLINTDELLDEVDLKKPTPLDKFDCGTSASGKKKACKNCSCGLAQELDAAEADEKKSSAPPAAKSSCGSCYLGDAFRCASCPYLGMPAFKPGEKVQLATTSDL